MKARLIGTFLLLMLAITAKAQTDHVAAANITLPAHPRILLLKGEEEGIKRIIASDKTWGKVNQAILTECDKMIDLPPVERIKIGFRLLDKSREGLRRLFYLSYAYRMTHQEKYLKRAEKELLAISAFSDWNPVHFLDIAEMTTGVAIAYDWLYNDLSISSRNIIRDAIIKKGLEPSLNPKYTSWLHDSNNWNQVCNTGLSLGALAVYEDDPALAKKIINRAIDSIALPMSGYNPNGAYPEGYGYWNYGTSFNVLFISAMEKVFHTDFGLTAKPGFMQTAAYFENMTGPTGQAYNYSDSGLFSDMEPDGAMFWFADKLKDPSLLFIERSYLEKGSEKDYRDNRLLPAAMIWNGGINTQKMTAPKNTVWVGGGKTPVALMRTSWTDPNAIFVGTKGGSGTTGHAHLDAGSFVMEADGVRWAMDFGPQDYNSLESKGLSIWSFAQNSQRWSVFRYNNMAHGTLTFNNELQRVDGKADITSYSKEPLFMNAVIDLSSIYKGSVARANRGIAIINKEYVVVRDEIQSLPKEATVRWTMLTAANVNIISNSEAELTKNGKKLLLKVQNPGNIVLKTRSTQSPNDYDSPNPGTTFIDFEVTLPANTNTPLTVLLIPEKAIGKAIEPVKSLAQWPH